MSELVLITDPRVLAVPIRENGDPLADTRQIPRLRVDRREDDGSGAAAMLRREVTRRLARAAERLPDGLEILLVEGLRPVTRQRRLFQEYLGRLRVAEPDWPEDVLLREATRYVAPPDGVPPHSTGGAVDLTLCDEDGAELDLGSPFDADPLVSAGNCYTAADGISSQARRRREALGAALTAEDFVNYPTEWWHWSYGDRYWAYCSGRSAALYGSAAWSPGPRGTGPRPTGHERLGAIPSGSGENST